MKSFSYYGLRDTHLTQNDILKTPRPSTDTHVVTGAIAELGLAMTCLELDNVYAEPLRYGPTQVTELFDLLNMQGRYDLVHNI